MGAIGWSWGRRCAGWRESGFIANDDLYGGVIDAGGINDEVPTRNDALTKRLGERWPMIR